MDISYLRQLWIDRMKTKKKKTDKDKIFIDM